MLMEWLKKAPPTVLIVVIIVGGLGFLGLVGGFVALDLAGQDTADYRTFVNTLANLIMLPLTGLGTVAAVTAARSASRAEDQTNGQLSARDAKIAELHAALNERETGSTGPSYGAGPGEGR